MTQWVDIIITLPNALGRYNNNIAERQVKLDQMILVNLGRVGMLCLKDLRFGDT